jgi:hypothetical protein
MKRTVTAERGVKPAGPYSHATVANGFVFVSGQGPFDPETNSAPDAFPDQVRQIFENLRNWSGRGGKGQCLSHGSHAVRRFQRSLPGVLPKQSASSNNGGYGFARDSSRG